MLEVGFGRTFGVTFDFASEYGAFLENDLDWQSHYASISLGFRWYD